MAFPMTTQPASQNPPGGWMPVPTININCPPGLEYLTQVDQLLVHQKVELMEAFTGFETANKYAIKNSMGQQVYFAAEDTDCCTRNCCGNMRPFDLKIVDNRMQEVMHVYRPLRCTGCCYPCCLQELEVSSPPGTIIGYVKEKWSFCVPLFDIQNAAGDTVLTVKGPWCTSRCCSDINYPIFSRDGETQIGKISKQWTGLAREAFTKADHFGVNFPLDLDVNIKAVILGALFLIDFLYFEHDQ